MSLFDEIDYRLSVVKRWNTVQTIRTQSVAEHEHNVAKIAHRLAERMGLSDLQRYGVVMYGLHHDDPEGITGDLASYNKPFFDERALLANVPAWQDRETDDGDAGDQPIVHFVVKAADYIDALIFLRMEVSLGNKTVAYHLRHLDARFRKYLDDAVVNGIKSGSGVYSWYQVDISDALFGGNGQYVSEVDGFPKSSS